MRSFASRAGLVVSSVLACATTARAQDHGDAIASARSAVATWAANRPATDPLRGEALDASAVRSDLTEAATRLEELAAQLVDRRRRIVADDGVVEAPTALVQGRIDVREVRGVKDVRLPPLGWVLDVPHPVVVLEGDRDSDLIGCGIDRDIIHDLVDRLIASEATPGNVANMTNDILHVRATAEKVELAKRAVGVLGEATRSRVVVDVRTFQVPHALLSEIGIGQLDEAADKRLAREGTLLSQHAVATRLGGTSSAWTGDQSSVVGAKLRVGSGVQVQLVPTPGGATLAFGAATAHTKNESSVLAERAATTTTIPLGKPVLIAGWFGDRVVRAIRVEATVAGEPPSVTGVLAPPRATTPRKPIPDGLEPAQRDEVVGIDALVDTIQAATADFRERASYRLFTLDVRDLATQAPSFFVPQLGENSENVFALARRRLDTDQIEATLKNLSGGDEAWSDPASYQLVHGVVFTNQTPDVLALMKETLANMRAASAGTPVRVEVGLYGIDTLETGIVGPNVVAKLDAAERKGAARLQGGGFALVASGESFALQEGMEQLDSGVVRRTGFRAEGEIHESAGGFAVTLVAKRSLAPGEDTSFLANVEALIPAGGAFVTPVRVGKEPLYLVVRAR